MNTSVYLPVACPVLCYVQYTFLQMTFVVAHFKELTG